MPTATRGAIARDDIPEDAVTERPIFDGINLVVGDMGATVAFYRRLGVDVPDGTQEWDPHHRNADVGSGTDFDFDSVAFAGKWDEGWPGGPGAVIGFRVESREEVDRVFADLTGAGYRGQQPPYDAFWGARYAIVEDPDGNAVGLMSPSDPERRSTATPPS
jgi:catechol 2,3-dioxygenase-like lactoylglutathione lyase family enzyme